MMDSRSIQTIIEKMEVVRDSLITSVDEETALEEQAIRVIKFYLDIRTMMLLLMKYSMRCKH